jgi:hypothetical protein
VNSSHIPNFKILGRGITLLRNQLLQVLDCILQLGSLSLTRLELLISLVQLDFEVVDVALGSDQLIMGVLQPGTASSRKSDFTSQLR